MFNSKLKEEMRLTRLLVDKTLENIPEMLARIELLEVRLKKLEGYR